MNHRGKLKSFRDKSRIVTRKPFSRKVQDLGNGCLGASIPAELVREHGLDAGDEVPLDFDRDEGVLKFYLD